MVAARIGLITVQAWAPLRSVIEAVLSQRLGFGQVSLSFGGILAFAVTLWVSWLARCCRIAPYRGGSMFVPYSSLMAS